MCVYLCVCVCVRARLRVYICALPTVPPPRPPFRPSPRPLTALACGSPKPIRRYGCGGKPGAVRLVGGRSPQEGTVQVCRNVVWGTICDTNWNDVDARVVCRQLGFANGAAVSSKGQLMNGTVYGHTFPQGPSDMKVLYSNLDCHDTDVTLDSCVRRQQECKSNGSSRQDAGVVCW
ncbi:hypothetical protein Vretifemale_13874 [Volvox reticuliferus]|uniref:SRCR domain-containing protein n=1 Tax=Volvox reticuliferus TaxID=1737510 RepID=A0A8J4CNI0_9CHLO|nr:hypothetical protein Vretifemale_13874 [Volvox reticuliferus]